MPRDERAAHPFFGDQGLQFCEHARARPIADFEFAAVEVRDEGCGLMQLLSSLQSRWTVIRSECANHWQLGVRCGMRWICHPSH